MSRKGPGANQGLHVDTLYYRYTGNLPNSAPITTDDEQPSTQPVVGQIEVPVKVLIKKEYAADAEGTNRPVRAVSFILSCDSPEFRLCGTDIEVLRSAAWEQLDKQFAIHWQPYFLVTIEREKPYGGEGEGVSIRYKTVYRGTAHDGTLLLRDHDHLHRSILKPWPGAFTDQAGRAIACIEATDENRKALETFCGMLSALREQIKDRFRPAEIQRTLATLASSSLALTQRGAA